MKAAILLLAALSLSACATSDAHLHDYGYYLANKRANQTTSAQFAHCRGYGCKYVDKVSLAEDDWAEIDAFFDPSPETPAEERERLRHAIGWFERRVGAITGTDEDVHGTFYKLGGRQQDCVDESTNTTIYLAVLDERGHLNHHRIRKPQMRPPFIGGGRWPHQTAVITETATGTQYAVDSWFHDNGAEPEIVLLSEWNKGWRPRLPSHSQRD